MNILAHILMTLILVNMFNVDNPIIILAAFVFGVLVDLDHVYTFFKKYDLNVFSSLNDVKTVFLNEIYGYKKRGYKRYTHDSGSLIVSLFVSILLRNSLPFFASLAHCVMDWTGNYESRPFAPFYKNFVITGLIKTRERHKFIRMKIILDMVVTIVLIIILIIISIGLG